MATFLTPGNDGYVADGGEIVHALEGNDQINIIHTDDSDFFGFDFDYFFPAEVYGNQGDDTIRSYGFGDRLYGDSGDDTLYGGGGRDQMFGGSGVDTIWTGTSDIVVDVTDALSLELDGDVVWAGAGNDTVHLQNADNEDTIRGEEGYDILHLYNGEGHIGQFSLLAGGSNSGLLASGFEELHYYGCAGFEVVEGGESFDFIYGNGGTDVISGMGAADWLAGEDGADVVNGGGGSDFIYGGADDDILSGQDGSDLIEGGSGDDNIADGKHGDVVKGDDGDDTIRTGEGADSVYGGNGDDVIREEGRDFTFRVTKTGVLIEIPGGDTLRGEAGDDDIRGGTGHDVIHGGRGGDTLDGGAGGDVMDGGEDSDLAFYGNGTVRIRLALDGSFAGEGEAEGDALVNIERVSGTDFGDVIRGDANANRLIGGGGADTLQGRDGADGLLGGTGADALTGGLGNDTFDYTSLAHGGDTIHDFSSNGPGDNDALRFTGSAFGGLLAGALAASRFAANATGLATTADHRFIYETDTGVLRFDSNGTGAGGVTVIATLTGAPALALADFAIL